MYPLIKMAHACARLLVCSCAMVHVLRSEIDMPRPRSQLYFTAQGLRSEMPANNRTHVILEELADRAANEEARRISSELGIVASLCVTCRPHVVKPICCTCLSANRLWSLCVVSGGWELRGTYADRTLPPARAALTRCFSNGV